MESSNEDIEVKIKISDKLKHLLIGLLTGALSVFVSFYIVLNYSIIPDYKIDLTKAYSNGLNDGFHIADSVYKEKLQEPLLDVPRSIGEVEIHAILLDKSSIHYLGLLPIGFDFGVQIPQNSTKEEIENIIKKETKKMGGNIAVMRQLKIQNQMFLDVYYKEPPKPRKKKWYEF